MKLDKHKLRNLLVKEDYRELSQVNKGRLKLSVLLERGDYRKQ